MRNELNGVKIGGNVKPRTVADLRNDTSITVAYLRGDLAQEIKTSYENLIDDKYEGNEKLKVHGIG